MLTLLVEEVLEEVPISHRDLVEVPTQGRCAHIVAGPGIPLMYATRNTGIHPTISSRIKDELTL